MAYFNFGSLRKVCCLRKFVFLKIAPFKRLLFGNSVWLGKDETLPRLSARPPHPHPAQLGVEEGS